MYDILHRVGIKASPREVYDALTTPEGLAAWWTTATSGDGKVGGILKFRFGSGGFDMKVLAADAGTACQVAGDRGPPTGSAPKSTSTSAGWTTTPSCCSSIRAGASPSSSCIIAAPSGARS